MRNHLNQDEYDKHAETWAVRAYVGEVRKPALMPEADINRDSWVIRAEGMSREFPGITVELIEITGIDANQYGYADKVWIVCNRDEQGRVGIDGFEEGPIWFNRTHYVIRASRAEEDDILEKCKAYTEWTRRTFGDDIEILDF